MTDKTLPTLGGLLKRPASFLAFGFGAGLAPKAPGTAGTLVGIPIYLAIASLPLMPYLAIVLAMFLVGIWFCQRAGQWLGVHDHGGIVWDEIVGYLVTMVAAPTGWLWVIIGFVLFRFFDIVKPWPIRWLDRHVRGGFGVMVDDVLAGVFALICIQVLAFLMLVPNQSI